MPRPNFNNKQPQYNNNWGRDREESNFRGENRDRRVTFKTNRYGKQNKNFTKDWGNAIREHLEDEDVDMGISSTSGKNYNNKNFNKKKGGRRGSPAPIGYRKLLEGPTSWYKVAIPYGEKYDKSFILKLLLDNLAPLPFCPIAWQTNGTTNVFFVDDFKVAEKLFSLDRQIQLPNGFKLILKVHPGTPNVDMTNNTKERIKQVMAKRYNAATKALDLTKFHADPDLQDIFCALFKPIVFLTVIEIIAENIPEIEALNLYDNKIATLGFLKNFSKKLPNLKILHMGNNKLRDLKQFDVLIGLPIVDLLLDGNPLCDKFKEHTTYISEVRKRFPKCVKLDGIDLPPPISFDISEESHLPDPQQTFLCSAEGEGIVRQFLEQYFQIYDTENRQPLLQAYHENAVFSITTAYPYGYGKDQKVAWLNWYQTDNRNLLRVQDSERRFKLLKQGQLAVVSFLQEMPETKHDIMSFTVDLTLFTPQMICLTVSGIYKEINSGHKITPIRFFFRTLIIVPLGTGFCIANEELHITNATPDQAKGAFKAVHTPAPAAVVATSPMPALPSTVALDDATKQEMVKQMSLKSGMNLEWSLKCLEEVQWDFFRATAIFEQLHSQGQIPPEAFIK